MFCIASSSNGYETLASTRDGARLPCETLRNNDDVEAGVVGVDSTPGVGTGGQVDNGSKHKSSRFFRFFLSGL